MQPTMVTLSRVQPIHRAETLRAYKNQGYSQNWVVLGQSIAQQSCALTTTVASGKGAPLAQGLKCYSPLMRWRIRIVERDLL